MRYVDPKMLMISLPLLAGSMNYAWGQSLPPVPSAGCPAPAAATTDGPRRETMAQRFAEANTTHDGHLTLAQAQAGFPAMARLFDRLDTDHKGYITMDQIHAYYEARRAARQANATQN
jgi:hypothetical protein